MDEKLRGNSVPKWIWNTTLDKMSEDDIKTQLKGFYEIDHYGGVMPVIWGTPGYMSERFWQFYRCALETARDLGMTITVWDENGFPTSGAGGLFGERHPDLTAKRLDMFTFEPDANGKVRGTLPEGKFMGAVAFNPVTKAIRELPMDCVRENVLETEAGNGEQVLAFVLIKCDKVQVLFNHGYFMDYLSREAVEAFIEETHEQYYAHFSEFFGSTIKYFFYDEPSFWQVGDGRLLTPDFNEKFQERYGMSAVQFYPAFFFDIGENTAAARAMLFGLRAELYADNFVGTLARWCEAHGVELTGHMDQEEVPNPSALCGDLMKVFRDQHMPGVDEIFAFGRGSRAYKIVSSAAYNYDKPKVMCEVYGAMGTEMPLPVLYQEAMDLFAKGVTFMVPHGTWYDHENNVIFPPELSFRTKFYSTCMGDYNDYTATCRAKLEYARHVSDIAVLYPIQTLNADLRFGDKKPYDGEMYDFDANYFDVGETLSLNLRRDFCYIHPEVLVSKCKVDGNTLYLDNKFNFERFRALILPSVKVIGADVMKKVLEFAKSGGTVITVGALPSLSALPGGNAEIRAMVSELLAQSTAYSMDTLEQQKLLSCLEKAGCDDVKIEPVATEGGNLTYIHKVKDGKDVYFFANSSVNDLTFSVKLRGEKELEAFDPAGKDANVLSFDKAEGYTTLKLELPAIGSLFLTQK